jgi:uncharacterized membrane protein YeaQ/YmgE (transglycosylase-associated protein family)
MSIIAIIILGALVGYIASNLLDRREGFFGSMIIGIIGSFIGSLVSRMVTGSDQSYLALSWSGLLWSLVGAVILVAILNSLSHRRHHTV